MGARKSHLSAAIVFGIGLVTVIGGAWLESRNPRSNLADDVAWCVLAAGGFLIGLGVSLPFAKPIVAVAVGLAFPLVGWWLLMCAVWGGLSYPWPSQVQLVRSGYGSITEARQIDDLFGPAWHSVSNYQQPDLADWQTKALFAGKYQLNMLVRVRVDRHSGAVEGIGKPHFWLREIEEIKSSREVSYNTDQEHEFGAEQWREVVKAHGDFSVIGIHLDRSHPAPGFDRYRAELDDGIQMRPRGDAAPMPQP
jgi:hypothetical protein